MYIPSYSCALEHVVRNMCVHPAPSLASWCFDTQRDFLETWICTFGTWQRSIPYDLDIRRPQPDAGGARRRRLFRDGQADTETDGGTDGGTQGQRETDTDRQTWTDRHRQTETETETLKKKTETETEPACDRIA